MHPSHRNRLSAETSPYLQQHADNPVDWYPWGQEALDKARREDKPILLSIGYSACHWCHVMAHESFEDPDTARVMNELFVNVKVDREERPDLDKVYQLAHQIIARRPGGWPLTVFLNPHNQLPFFTGTYFPKTARYQLPDFVTVLHKVAEHYRQQKDELRRHDQALAGILKAIQREGPADAPDPRLLAAARQALDSEFDAVHGGFGGAPKFPQASNLELLLYLTRLDETGDPGRCTWPPKAWRRWPKGAVRPDRRRVLSVFGGQRLADSPLRENALRQRGAAAALCGSLAAHRSALFRRVAEATAEWVLREMRAPEGGFYSALDADSEGEEGKYYLWDRAEVRALLDPDEYALVERHYGLDQTPNFEARWHLHVERPLPEVAQGLGLDPGAAEQRLAAARAKLYAARQRRVRPGLDDKRLTAWNALMIKGLAAAGRRLGRDEYIAAAETAFAFLRRSAVDADGHLLATYKGGEARLKAYLDDYAFLLDAGLELLQCRWRSDDLGWLLNLADQLLSRFEDRERGGFFFTAEDHEPLIQRPKSLADESLPAGNGVAALALLRLGQLVGEPRYSEAAERALKAAVPVLRQFPHGHGALLLALAEWLHPAELVILRGRPEGLGPWLAAARRGDRRRLVFAIPNDAGELPGDLAARRAEDGEVAYLCTGTSCLPPIRSMEELVRSPR